MIIRLPHPLIVEWMLWQHAAGRWERETIVERVRGVVQFAREIDGSPITVQTDDVIRWLARHTDWTESVSASRSDSLQAWFSWLCLMDHRVDNPMLKLASPQVPLWRRRDVDVVDRELRLLTTVRAPRLAGGRSSTAAVDQLLDERLEILTSVGPSGSVQCN